MLSCHLYRPLAFALTIAATRTVFGQVPRFGANVKALLGSAWLG
jgi:hypothetical protein